jgi:hypothetical protein
VQPFFIITILSYLFRSGQSGNAGLIPKIQDRTGSSTLSEEKKLTLPSVTRQIFNGMPPYYFSTASIFAPDGG